ncbi:ABC transporter substrate-binding protein [Neorhizobium sp. NCHU2750]|uniref:ABC transporter substrate-binding protein n=1 Tax=Neorhizobium sp. NCHU2750 TaxID=1825976 RepID=UPI000E753A1E|nr:sn-glycerol-3-phosphate ABC transporter substrate-binding protein [Neorhizobium sp. NCHU2750]
MMTSFSKALAGLALASTIIAGPAFATEINFYYPIAVGGPITKIVDGYVAEFEKANPDITVKPVYTGSYQDSIVKAMTAARAGNAPDVAVLLSTDMFTLIDADMILPFDQVATSADDSQWLKSFYPAFMANSQAEGHTWGVPFQRSTIVQYYNKEAFKKAGITDAPKTWDEMVAAAKKLKVKDASGNVTQWGVEIPSSGFPYWLFQALAIENGAELANQDGTKVNYNGPAVVEAAQFFADLGQKDGVMPKGIIDWGTTPKDFFEGKTAMMWTTTGNLTNVRANAKFDFGVAELPAKVQGGSPTGGGNVYLFKTTDKAKQEASLKLAKFLTSKELAADWGIQTGYVATRPDAWETDRMKAYVKDFPAAAVARDQLKVAKAELSVHDNQQVTKALNDALQAILTGTSAAKPALDQAQKTAEGILASYQN